MKSKTIIIMLMHLGALAYGESPLSPLSHPITVCVTSDAYGLPVARAKILASEMFGQIGLSIHWQQSSRSCPEQAILLTIGLGTPNTFKPTAFAYALPYEGRHIRVFYDRIANSWAGCMLEVVLAHVIVHEITHILQGVKRHSERGVMKAAWDSSDYFHMRERPLEFTDEDVELIYLGLVAQQKRAMLGSNAEHTVLRLKLK